MLDAAVAVGEADAGDRGARDLSCPADLRWSSPQGFPVSLFSPPDRSCVNADIETVAFLHDLMDISDLSWATRRGGYLDLSTMHPTFGLFWVF